MTPLELSDAGTITHPCDKKVKGVKSFWPWAGARSRRPSARDLVGEARPPVKAGRVDLGAQPGKAEAAPPRLLHQSLEQRLAHPVAAKLRENGHPADLDDAGFGDVEARRARGPRAVQPAWTAAGSSRSCSSISSSSGTFCSSTKTRRRDRDGPFEPIGVADVEQL